MPNSHCVIETNLECPNQLTRKWEQLFGLRGKKKLKDNKHIFSKKKKKKKKKKIHVSARVIFFIKLYWKAKNNCFWKQYNLS